jgi:hypothetical protein
VTDPLVVRTPARARRAAAGFALAAVLLCGAVGWGYLTMADAADEAAVAATDLAVAGRSADHIVALRGAGGLAATRPWRPEDLRGKIAKAAAEGDLPEDGLGTIDEQPPRRLPGSPFQERPTQVTLRGVTVPELIGFLYAVLEDAPGLRVTQLRLSAGREGVGGREAADDEPARWAADVTFSVTTPAADATPARAAAAAGTN